MHKNGDLEQPAQQQPFSRRYYRILKVSLKVLVRWENWMTSVNFLVFLSSLENEPVPQSHLC